MARSVGVGVKRRRNEQVNKYEQDYTYTYESKKKDVGVLKKSKGYDKGLQKRSVVGRSLIHVVKLLSIQRLRQIRSEIEEATNSIKLSTEVNNATAIEYICQRICRCW